MPELRQYINRQGRNAFERWFDKLDDTTRARITVALARLQQGSSAVKGVGAGVMELRIDLGPGYRVYFGKNGEALIILLGGGTKKRQHLDIVAAQKRFGWSTSNRRRSNDAAH